MSEIKLPAEELEKARSLWAELTEEQLDTAQKIVPLLREGDIFEHEVTKRGNPPLYIVQRGVAVKASGTAEMLEYGAAQFEGEKFSPLDEPGIVVAGLGRYLAFPTGHVAPYRNDYLRIEQVSGFVDFDNPMVEVTGDGYPDSTSVFRLEANPVILD